MLINFDPLPVVSTNLAWTKQLGESIVFKKCRFGTTPHPSKPRRLSHKQGHCKDAKKSPQNPQTNEKYSVLILSFSRFFFFINHGSLCRYCLQSFCFSKTSPSHFTMIIRCPPSGSKWTLKRSSVECKSWLHPWEEKLFLVKLIANGTGGFWLCNALLLSLDVESHVQKLKMDAQHFRCTIESNIVQTMEL